MRKGWHYLCSGLFGLALPVTHATTLKEFIEYGNKVNQHCISEAGAKLAFETAMKNFPSKEAFLSLKRSEIFTLAAPTLLAAKPYLKSAKPPPTPEQQYAWLESFLKDPNTQKFYDHPVNMPWDVEYYEPVYVTKSGKEAGNRTYKKYPKKKICITNVTIRTPNVACLNNQRLEIDFSFDSGGANDTALLRSIGLSPLPCDL